jgi:hypothetical protein
MRENGRNQSASIHVPDISTNELRIRPLRLADPSPAEIASTMYSLYFHSVSLCGTQTIERTAAA